LDPPELPVLQDQEMDQPEQQAPPG